MPTPYDRSAPVVPVPAPGAGRPPLARPVHGRRLVGVCAGLAAHLGVPVGRVRLAMVVLGLLGGSSILIYPFLWALMPETDQIAGPDAVAAPTASGSGRRRGVDDRWGGVIVAGLGLVLVGGLLLSGVAVDLWLPILVVLGGVTVAWSRLDDAERGRLRRGDPGVPARHFPVTRVALGGVLTVLGLVVLTIRGLSVAAVWDAFLAAVAVLVGVVLIAAPWVLRFWGDLRREQDAKARETERADIAAHLHDSVLQTLALIQRRADDPAAVQRLARTQERELRAWLYAGPSGADSTLAAAMTTVAHEVEDLHAIPIEVVATGDQDLDPAGEALVKAFREALLNAVRHGRPPVTAYVEIGPAGVDAFVRDHGDGFDLAAVPDDRLGVRQSILGRMERHGGTARVRHRDDGTEVELHLPPPPKEQP